VEDFLKNYKHQGKHYLGEMVKDGKNWYIKVSTEFYKSTSDSTGIDWEAL
jgi:hypothetical protein